MTITTKKGDGGETSIWKNKRVFKDHHLIEVIGDLDELGAALSMARAEEAITEHKDLLLKIQKTGFTIRAEIACPEDQKQEHQTKLEEGDCQLLDYWIQRLEAKNVMPRDWLIAGENRLDAAYDFARCVSRRAERKWVGIMKNNENSNPWLLVYLNRLSDLLWMLMLDAQNRTVLQDPNP